MNRRGKPIGSFYDRLSRGVIIEPETDHTTKNKMIVSELIAVTATQLEQFGRICGSISDLRECVR